MASSILFATLKPSNARAKLAFHSVFESLPNVKHVFTEPELVFDENVCRLRLRETQNELEGEASDTGSETDAEVTKAPEAMGRVTNGYYAFDLKRHPEEPEIGWTAGKGRDTSNVDLIITTKQRRDAIRGIHVIFNFSPKTGFLTISSKVGSHSDGLVTVDGQSLQRGETSALNNHHMKIRLGLLEYDFQYEDLRSNEAFKREHADYVRKYIASDKNAAVNFGLTPTPSGQRRIIGQWTLGKALGKGGFGKVSCATNSSSRIVAIKRVERNPMNRASVDRELQTLRDITQLALDQKEQRIVRLLQIIREPTNASSAFEEIALVMEPVAHGTFKNLVQRAQLRFKDQQRPLDSVALKFFYDALMGVNFLHNNGWVHADLKPVNIGICGTRAVLLDIDNAVRLELGRWHAGGTAPVGTVGYMSPERATERFDHFSDVWSMGIVGFELMYVGHPWEFTKNPWRREMYEGEHRSERQSWEIKYRAAMDRIGKERDAMNALAGAVVGRMLLKLDPKENPPKRISIAETLAHPAWQQLGVVGTTGEPAAKKAKT